MLFVVILNFMIKKFVYTVLFFIVLSLTGYSAETDNLRFNGFISDNANIVSYETEQKLNKILLDLQNKTKTDIAVVTLKSLENKPIEDVSLEIGRKYKLGDKVLNNGALIVVAPNDKEARIEIGYGLEGMITDAHAGRILDDYMIPYFHRGDYNGGIFYGTTALAYDIAKAFNAELSYKNPLQKTEDDFGFLLILIIIIFLMAFNNRGGGGLMFFGRGGGYPGIKFGGGGGFGGGGASRKW